MILDGGIRARWACVHDHWAWQGIYDAFASSRTISRALTVFVEYILGINCESPFRILSRFRSPQSQAVAAPFASLRLPPFPFVSVVERVRSKTRLLSLHTSHQDFAKGAFSPSCATVTVNHRYDFSSDKQKG